MARKPRMYIPNIPTHIVQRGNNKEPCFFNDADYRFYLERLKRSTQRYNVKLHAYALMPNHVHLLMTPSDEQGVSKVMSLLGQYYVQYINRTYNRSGTLWEGRHKASLIDAERYLLLCYKYIELKPVRAGVVISPGIYPWSSYSHHAWGKPNNLINDHDVYLRLGISNESRSSTYRDFFENHFLARDDIDKINNAINFNYPLGDNNFKQKIERILNRKIGFAKRGRPSLRLVNESSCA